MDMILSAVLMLVLAATPPKAPAAPDTGTAYPSEEALRRYMAGRLLEEQGQRAEALDQYYRALVLDPRAVGVARRVSELKLARGDSEGALEFAERALAADPGDARAAWLRGAALLNMERPEEALAPLRAAVAADSERVTYWRTLALAADATQEYRLAAEAWRRAAWLDEDDGETWFQYAAASARIGRFGAADTAAQRAGELNPLRPGLLYLQGWIAENRGDNATAADLYRHQIAVGTSDEAVHRRLLTVLARDERWKEALAEARPIAAAHPDDLEIRHLYIDLCFRAGQKNEGMKAIEQLRRDQPDAPGAVAVRVDALARHGQAAAAAAEAEAWSAAHPEDVRGYGLAAFARQQQGRIDLAEGHLRRALVVAPESLGVWYTLGRFLVEQKRLRSAESLYVAGVARFPAEDGLWFSLAGTRERLDDLPGAEAAVRDVLRRDPSDASALNFLGYMWADRGVRLDEAEVLVKRALEADPDNGAYLDSLGWIYYRLGRYDEARALLERAVERTRGDAEVRQHLGDLYKSLKLNDLAKEQYRLALQADPANPALKGKLQGMR